MKLETNFDARACLERTAPDLVEVVLGAEIGPRR